MINTAVYYALSDIYLKGSWISEATKRYLPGSGVDPKSFRLIHSVVERDFLAEYRISLLTDRAPKTSAKIILKIGMALLDVFDMPEYAAVNDVIEMTKSLGKQGLCGFVNAVLRRYIKEGRELYPEDPVENLAARANRPLWQVKRYIAELGIEEAEKRLLTVKTEHGHIRPARSFGKDALRKELEERGCVYEETEHGFYINGTCMWPELYLQGKATVMSWSSIEVCETIPYEGGLILDLCAAPGGKSVYLSEKFDAKVVSCDQYIHRVKLINDYAQKFNAKKISTILLDARELIPEWKEKFSLVLLDAPCSGFGSLATNGDVVLHRTEKDVEEIIKLQKQLISVAAEYVKAGGVLAYATCSDLPSEDENVVRMLLSHNSRFTLEKEKHTDPVKGGGESYYCAILRKK